ncbi:MAG: hypothetical protein ACRBB0_02170 [Pelagimonas sp.]|uniref:hypothetical protein n=1 Tax=Pelagimonas sp. TaxID=2073170 RepID=UPI003D6BFEB9
MFVELALPAIVLMVLAVVVPRLVETFLPETLFGMAIIAALSSLILWILASLGFAMLYQWENPRLAALLFSSTTSWPYFLNLGAKAAVIWGPVLALTVSTTPRRWKTNTW